MICTYKEYVEDKGKFFAKHKNKFETHTSPMVDDVYHKEYVFDDGAVWYEVMSPYYTNVDIEVNKCKLNIEVKLFRTEYWDSDNAKSRFYFEEY